jgi:hypothetical protein
MEKRRTVTHIRRRIEIETEIYKVERIRDDVGDVLSEIGIGHFVRDVLDGGFSSEIVSKTRIP